MLRPEFQINLHTKTKPPAVEWNDSRTEYFRLCMTICLFFLSFFLSFILLSSPLATATKQAKLNKYPKQYFLESDYPLYPSRRSQVHSFTSRFKLFAHSPHVHTSLSYWYTLRPAQLVSPVFWNYQPLFFCLKPPNPAESIQYSAM